VAQLDRYLCVCVDLMGYGSRPTVEHDQVQADMANVLADAAARAAVRQSAWRHQVQGDAVVSLVPAAVGHEYVVGEFCLQLETALRRFNAGRSEPRRMRLRLALDEGPVNPAAAQGYTGDAVVGAARLANAPAARMALDADADAALAVMVSLGVYRDFVRSGWSAARAEWFRRVRVALKEYDEDAWLWLPGRGVPAPAPPGPPIADDAARRRLLVERAPAWEWLLLADGLWRAMDRLRAKQHDHDLRLAVGAGQPVPDAGLRGYVRGALDRLRTIANQTVQASDQSTIDRAVGGPGESGDPERIDHLAYRIGQTYETLLDWAAEVRRAVPASDDGLTALALLARVGEEPARSVRQWIEAVVAAGRTIAADGGGSIDLPLVVGVDHRQVDQLTAYLSTMDSR
jgi:hypothetical protein